MTIQSSHVLLTRNTQYVWPPGKLIMPHAGHIILSSPTRAWWRGGVNTSVCVNDCLHVISSDISRIYIIGFYVWHPETPLPRKMHGLRFDAALLREGSCSMWLLITGGILSYCSTWLPITGGTVAACGN